MNRVLTELRTVLRKDLYHVRWLAVAWIAFVIVQAWQRANVLDGATARPQTLSLSWHQPLAFVVLLFAIVVISAIVHDDPVPGTRSFWLTRPIGHGRMFAGKALGLLLVIVVPGLIAESLLMARWGVSLFDLLHANAELLFVSVTGLSLLFAAAALAKHGGEFLVLIGATIACTLITLTTLVRSLVRWMLGPDFLLMIGLPAKPAWPLITAISWTFIILTFGGITWWYYRTRRRAATFALLLACFVACLFLPGLLARALPMRMPPPIDAAWASPDRLHAQLLLDERSLAGEVVRDEDSGRELDELRMNVKAPIVLDTLPADYTATPYVSDAQIAVDGVILQSASSGHTRYTAPPSSGHPRASLAQASPGPLERSYGPPPFEEWPVIMELPKSQFQRYAQRPGRYTANVTYLVRHHEPLGWQPLGPGRVQIDRSRRVELLGASTDDEGACVVETRIVDLDFRWADTVVPQPALRFQDRDGHPLRGLRVDGGFEPFALSLMPVSPNSTPSPLHVYHARVRIVSRDYKPRDKSLVKPIACADVRWTGLRTTTAGTITRRLDVANVILASPEPTRAQPRR